MKNDQSQIGEKQFNDAWCNDNFEAPENAKITYTVGDLVNNTTDIVETLEEAENIMKGYIEECYCECECDCKEDKEEFYYLHQISTWIHKNGEENELKELLELS
jgi:hypothetical protein